MHQRSRGKRIPSNILKMEKQTFHSKILLFGEYSIIQESMGLSLPYELFYGQLSFDKKEIDGLNNGVLAIYEPGLDDMAKRNAEQKRLTFSADPITSIKGVDVVVSRYILYSLFPCSHMTTYNKTHCFSHSLLPWVHPVVVMEERILVMWMMLQKWLQKMLLPKLYW